MVPTAGTSCVTAAPVSGVVSQVLALREAIRHTRVFHSAQVTEARQGLHVLDHLLQIIQLVTVDPHCVDAFETAVQHVLSLVTTGDAG
jgi:hypothetical protein